MVLENKGSLTELSGRQQSSGLIQDLLPVLLTSVSSPLCISSEDSFEDMSSEEESLCGSPGSDADGFFFPSGLGYKVRK